MAGRSIISDVFNSRRRRTVSKIVVMSDRGWQTSDERNYYEPARSLRVVLRSICVCNFMRTHVIVNFTSRPANIVQVQTLHCISYQYNTSLGSGQLCIE